jgi:hypothetical protein
VSIKQVNNTFEKGMHRDSLPYLQPPGTIRHAKNMVFGDRFHKGYGLSFEESNELLKQYDFDIIGAEYVESENAIVVFTVDGSIHMYYTETKNSVFLAKDSEFGCDWKFSSCGWINPYFKTDQPCNELKIYWSSGCEYHVLNVAEMLSTVRKNALKESINNNGLSGNCGNTCDHFNIMRCVGQPSITSVVLKGGGNRIEGGAYQFAVQYVGNDLNESNWYDITSPVYVETENNQAGELSKNSIRVDIDNLDCSYDSIRIAVISSVGEVVTANVVSEQSFNTKTTSFLYTGQTGRAISLQEIKTKRKTYIKGRELIIKDNRLWLYKIKQEFNLNLQKRVLENTSINFVELEVSPEIAEKHHTTSWERGESYLYGIKYNFCDGTSSNVFLTKPKGQTSQIQSPVVDISSFSVTGSAQTVIKSSGGINTEPRSSGSETDSEKDNIDNWTTDTQNLVDSAACSDCQGSDCTGCVEDNTSLESDMPLTEDTYASHTDELSHQILDTDVSYDSGDFKSAASKLIDAVDNAEVRSVTGGTIKTSNTVNVTQGATYPNQYILSDKYGGLLKDKVKVVQKINPEVKLSTKLYPDTKDCNGEYYFGDDKDTPVKLFKVPDSDLLPCVVPTQLGVPSKHSNIDPTKSVKIRLIGLEVSNVPIPSDEDLPKPLDKNRPWEVVYIKRDYNNSTIQAKGHICGTFKAVSNGEEVKYVRHGANSRTFVDKWINTSTGSRKGVNDDGAAFYSLDVSVEDTPLSGGKLVITNRDSGVGERYGLFEEGVKPDQPFTGKRADQRGARQFININVKTPLKSEHNIEAIGKVKSNGVSYIEGSNASYKVSSANRESFVYIQAEGGLNLPTDSSFTTDTKDHSCPIPDAYLNSAYIKREIEDQYGDVSGMSFISTGVYGKNFTDTHVGISGDVFVGYHTFVKKGYVSDKVGNTYPTPGKPRTVCDSPNPQLLQTLGIDWYATKLPISGDESDAKNWAGGHANASWDQAYPNEPSTDIYYYKLVKTLILVWGESRTNPWLRATGVGSDQSKSGQVYYPKIKNLHLDSGDSSDKKTWENGFLNQFYYGVEQPSTSQLVKKSLIKSFVLFALPALGVTLGLDMDSVSSTVKSMLVFPLLASYWYTMKNLLIKEEYLDNLLGLPTCKTDEKGGENDNYIRGFEDNYYDYNYDYSLLNNMNFSNSIPLNYNTCKCDDCEGGKTNNEIYYSNKQIQGSQIDFFKQFGALSYLSISADTGKLNKLFVYDGDLFAHTSDFIIPLKYKEFGETSAGMSRLGGNLIIDPSSFMEGIKAGFGGIIDPNSCIITVFGYVWIDREARKLYIFNGKYPNEVSSYNLEKFFQEFLYFCDETGCVDNKKKDSVYFSIGYDPQNNRILVTKKDKDLEKSWTVGFTPSEKEFISDGFHEYIPQSYISDRKNLITTYDKGLWLHNANNGSYCNFYGKQYYPEVELVALSDGSPFKFVDVELYTECEKGGLKNLDITFNKVSVYNSTQGTGTKDLVVSGDNKDKKLNPSDTTNEKNYIPIHKKRRNFTFNKVRDSVKKSCKEEILTLKNKCIPIENINEGIFECLPNNVQDFSGRVMFDDHIVYRFSYVKKEIKELIRLLMIKTKISIENTNN